MQPYERFKAWHACHALAITTYRITLGWPDQERFGLVTQARRAAFSAGLNIVEGSARRGPREFRRFLDISIGSLAELGYVFRIAADTGILAGTDYEALSQARDQAARLTWGLYAKVRKAAS